MGRISSDVGLISGINITDTVDKLIALQSQPKKSLETRQKTVTDKQKALTELTAAVLGVQLSIRRLNSSDAFTKRTTATSAADVLTATASSAVPVRTYSVTAARTAQTHQVASNGVSSTTTALGAGTFSVSLGGFVNQGVSLADLNGGAGVTRGFIRITDRSGKSADVDLRAAKTIDDVLEAINGATDVSVKAEAIGDSLKLTDLSGETTSNLRVQEVGSGTTAAGLGLSGINAAVSSATGSDILSLFAGIKLDSLNDGNGVSIRDGVSELNVSFRDQTSLSLSFDDETTLGDLVETINAADPARLQASISNNRLVLTDLTSDTGGAFAVTSTPGGSLAHDLGLEGTASGAALTGDALVGGLKTTLLRSLGGGTGLGPLGNISITNRNGDPATTVDLTNASTLDDVIATINGAAAGVTASYNSSRNGIVITDTTGGSGNLVIADADANNAATRLNIPIDAAVTSVDSGSLSRQTVNEHTLLKSLNGGSGVRLSNIVIKNRNGAVKALNLSTLQPKTVGDVIDAVNSLNAGVTAKINATGDGISIVDTTNGTGSLTITDSTGGKSAADLHIAGSTTGTTITGSPAITVSVEADDTLEDLVTKLNELGGPFTASIATDGDGSLPHRLQLISKVSGKAGALLIDTNVAGLQFSDITAPRDAAVLVGASSTSAGRLVTSSSNVVQGVVDGLNVSIGEASENPVTITVKQNVDAVTSGVKLFVDQYNKLRDKVDSLDYYQSEDNSKGLFFGSTETLRLNNDLASQLTGRHFGVGRFQSLAQLGVSTTEDGKLTFDSGVLSEKLQSADGDDVVKFFSDDGRGFAKKVDDTLETLVGRNNSLFVNKLSTLASQSEQNTERIKFMQERLDVSRTKLLNQFYRMELAIGKIQSNNSYLTSLQSLATQLTNG